MPRPQAQVETELIAAAADLEAACRAFAVENLLATRLLMLMDQYATQINTAREVEFYRNKEKMWREILIVAATSLIQFAAAGAFALATAGSAMRAGYVGLTAVRARNAAFATEKWYSAVRAGKSIGAFTRLGCNWAWMQNACTGGFITGISGTGALGDVAAEGIAANVLLKGLQWSPLLASGMASKVANQALADWLNGLDPTLQMKSTDWKGVGKKVDWKGAAKDGAALLGAAAGRSHEKLIPPANTAVFRKFTARLEFSTGNFLRQVPGIAGKLLPLPPSQLFEIAEQVENQVIASVCYRPPKIDPPIRSYTTSTMSCHSAPRPADEFRYNFSRSRKLMLVESGPKLTREQQNSIQAFLSGPELPTPTEREALDIKYALTSFWTSVYGELSYPLIMLVCSIPRLEKRCGELMEEWKAFRPSPR